MARAIWRTVFQTFGGEKRKSLFFGEKTDIVFSFQQVYYDA